MRWKSLAACTVLVSACHLPDITRPPTAGYGAPYRGTGQPIYVKDSRTDWEIREGGVVITAAQALEAAGDPAYETRRQEAKRHNDRLYEIGQARRARARLLTRGSVVTFLVGVAAALILPPLLATESVMPATAIDPERRTQSASFGSNVAGVGGVVVALGSTLTWAYAIGASRKQPPYHAWRVPAALDRPAYVRQQTEAINQKLDAPAIAPESAAPAKAPRASLSRRTLQMRGAR